MSDSNNNDNLDEVLFWAYILYRRYKRKAEQNINDSDSYSQINSSNLLPSLSKRKAHSVLYWILSIICLLCAILNIFFTITALYSQSYTNTLIFAIATVGFTVLWRILKKKRRL